MIVMLFPELNCTRAWNKIGLNIVAASWDIVRRIYKDLNLQLACTTKLQDDTSGITRKLSGPKVVECRNVSEF